MYRYTAGKVYCRRDVPKAVAKGSGMSNISLVKQMEAQKLSSDAVVGLYKLNTVDP